MKKEDWIWMPHPAHFIGASSCEFRLATYVGDYIVSTVGEYVSPSSGQVEDIGAGRKYETMVFKARKSDEAGHCGACVWFIDDAGNNLDMEPYNDPQSAYEGHVALCNKWASIGLGKEEK